MRPHQMCRKTKLYTTDTGALVIMVCELVKRHDDEYHHDRKLNLYWPVTEK